MTFPIAVLVHKEYFWILRFSSSSKQFELKKKNCSVFFSLHFLWESLNLVLYSAPMKMRWKKNFSCRTFIFRSFNQINAEVRGVIKSRCNLVSIILELFFLQIITRSENNLPVRATSGCYLKYISKEKTILVHPFHGL